jgi:hypothetical protein
MPWQTRKQYHNFVDVAGRMRNSVTVSLPSLPPLDLLPADARALAHRVLELNEAAERVRAESTELSRRLPAEQKEHRDKVAAAVVAGKAAPADPSTRTAERIDQLREEAAAVEAAIDKPLAALGDVLMTGQGELIASSKTRVVENVEVARLIVGELNEALGRVGTATAMLHWSRNLQPNVTPYFKGGGGIANEMTDLLARVDRLLRRVETDAGGPVLEAVEDVG